MAHATYTEEALYLILWGEMNKRGLGTDKERLAAEYLVKKGYKIQDMNFRTRFSEIDIIARQGSDLVFIEVKYRKNTASGYPEEAVNYKKQTRIRKASEYYMMTKGYVIDRTNVRYDVISIIGDEIYHIISAF